MDNVETWDEDVRKKLGDIPSAKAENPQQEQQVWSNQNARTLEKFQTCHSDYTGTKFKPNAMPVETLLGTQPKLSILFVKTSHKRPTSEALFIGT